MSDRGINFNETCATCGGTYKVQEVDTGPWSWQQQEIECPYCKKVRVKKTSGSFKTSKIAEE